MDRQEFWAALAKLLRRKQIGDDLRVDLEDLIVGCFGDTSAIDRVELADARVGVTTVEAYGLFITVDANGRAERIEPVDGGCFQVV